MRTKEDIQNDRRKSEGEKQTEILLDIREILNGKEVKKQEPFGGPIINEEDDQMTSNIEKMQLNLIKITK